MPAVLIEVAFISNPTEEKRLQDQIFEVMSPLAFLEVYIPMRAVRIIGKDQYFCNDFQGHSNMDSQQHQQWHNTQPSQSAQTSSNSQSANVNRNSYSSNHNENRNTNMGENHMSGNRSSGSQSGHE